MPQTTEEKYFLEQIISYRNDNWSWKNKDRFWNYLILRGYNLEDLNTLNLNELKQLNSNIRREYNSFNFCSLDNHYQKCTCLNIYIGQCDPDLHWRRTILNEFEGFFDLVLSMQHHQDELNLEETL